MRIPIAFLLLFLLIAGCSRRLDPDLDSIYEGYLRDRASILAPAERQMLEKQLGLLERETGVDLRVVTTELGAATSVEDYSREYLDRKARAARFSTRSGVVDLQGTAANFLERSSGAEISAIESSAPETPIALLVYDARSGRLRLEIGYALEQVFPDAFVGFLIREHARYLFDDGRPAQALLFSVRILRDQIRSVRLNGDLRSPSREAVHGYAHGGAGASDEAPIGGRSLDPFGRSAASTARAGWSAVGSPYYGRAGSSVEGAYQHYLAWMNAGRFETDLDLFTVETRRFLADWPMTPGYLEHVLNKELGKSFRAIRRENRVLYVCTDDPFVAPHFFELGDAGWQIDLLTEAREVININGGRFSWTLRDPAKSAWIESFSDEIVLLSDALRPSADTSRTRAAVRRLRDGDNREATLPVSPAWRFERLFRMDSRT